MTFLSQYGIYITVALFSVFISSSQVARAELDSTITVYPHKTRAIEGISQVERNRYFAIAARHDLDNRLDTPKQFDYLTQTLDARLGRSLGPLGVAKKFSNSIKEDPKKSGFTDLTYLKKALSKKTAKASEKAKSAFHGNMDIAAHGKRNGFPKFLGKFETKDSKKHPSHPEYLPLNIKGAAELSATILRFGYTNLTRPAFYEPVNEPHWSFHSLQHFADWHIATMHEVKKQNSHTKVGGPCLPVAYFYRNFYKSFNGLKNFMNNTDGQLDFYSFHAYDYHKSTEAGKNNSRITSGLPLEGMLDLVNNYSLNRFNKNVDLVISEHGGYVSNKDKKQTEYDGQWLALQLVPKEDNEDFSREILRRSTIQWPHLSSIIANTLTFMDHPHSVQKAVPFLLGSSSNWNPKYYATLYTPENYKRRASLKESYLLNYYRFFQGVNGRRIVVDSPDPDLQTRAFVDGENVYTIINNLSTKAHKVSIKGLKGAHSIRRINRDKNFIPDYHAGTLENTDLITLGNREAIAIISKSDKPLKEESITQERIFYGDEITLKTSPSANFKITIPNEHKVKRATLRLAIDRGPDSDYHVTVSLNGTNLEVPMEDAAIRYDDIKNGYATTKLIPIPDKLLKNTNSITVSFPDKKAGAVGCAVIRAEFE